MAPVPEALEPPRCPSCGLPFTEHRGIVGTCAALMYSCDHAAKLIREVERLRAANKKLRRRLRGEK